MSVTLHWFLPTNGDSRSDLSLGNAVGAAGSRVAADGSSGDRRPTLEYLTQIAVAAEQNGFTGALTPTSSWCEDALVTAAALSQHTDAFKYLVAFRPGMQRPTYAAHQFATFQRLTGNRLLLNVVVGGDDLEQRRYGDALGKDDRYARAGEALHVIRELWAASGEPVTFKGEHLWVEGAQIEAPDVAPEIFFGGSSPAAIEVAGRYVDVYLTWGEPPAAVAEKLELVRAAAARHDREVRFGIRLHAIARDTADDAWNEADRLLSGLDPKQIEAAQLIQRASQSEGQRRMTALHGGGNTDNLVVAPNLWAGVGLVRGGAGTALVGSHEEIADRIAEYHELGIDHFVLSGYPHLEEAYRFGECVTPVLRRRGLLAGAGSAQGATTTGGQS
ncbi:MAG: LLM class flavin-dependent oxidoreductase [Solirubrobacteraceae bacterium]|nr:LLM class flavin-dependent oxidoreductase [Solirubrobacteraceae bacterium]